MRNSILFHELFFFIIRNLVLLSLFAILGILQRCSLLWIKYRRNVYSLLSTISDWVSFLFRATDQGLYLWFSYPYFSYMYFKIKNVYIYIFNFKIASHLQLQQNIRYIPHAVQYILKLILYTIACDHTSPLLYCGNHW